MSTYFNTTVIAEWIALIFSFLLLFRQTGRWRLFIPFMILTVSIEWVGWYSQKFAPNHSNALPYNIYLIISTSFLLWFLSNYEYLAKVRKMIWYVIFVFVGFCIINMCFFEGFSKYNSISETVADLLLAIVSCYLMYSMFKNPKYENLLKSGYLWLAIGILNYSMGSALLYNFYDLLFKLNEMSGIKIAKYLNFSLAILLYSCMSISFITTWKTSES